MIILTKKYYYERKFTFGRYKINHLFAGLVIFSAYGLILDHIRDKRHGCIYDHHGNEHWSNVAPGMVFMWSIISAVILWGLL